MNASLAPDYDAFKIHYFLTDFENSIPREDFIHWGNGLSKVPPASVLVYLLVIHYGPKLMKNRMPMSVKWPLFAWNTFLAIFSAGCVLRIGAYLLHEWSTYPSMKDKICNSTVDNPSALWSFLFCLSKVFELGDTVFLIIRKKPIIFLHWYHHTTVLLFSWFAAMDQAPFCNIFASVNAVVHTFMYAYFACQTIGIKFPRYISISLTLIQISQMVVGLNALYLYYVAVSSGMSCMSNQVIWAAGVIMYGSYFALFVNFFIQSYFVSKGTVSSGVKFTDENANFKIE